MSRRPEEGTPRALIALRDELKANLRLWLRARIAFIAVVAIYVPFIAPDGAFLYMWALLAGFIITATSLSNLHAIIGAIVGRSTFSPLSTWRC